MKNSKPLLKNLIKKAFRPLSYIPKWLPISLGVVAVLGFADATYLVIEHYANKIPPCAFGNCELVLTSKFSFILGVPVSLLGSLYYLAMIVLVIAYFDTKKEVLMRLALWGSFAGMLAAVWFVFLQAFIIHAFCQFCLLSAAISTALFVISIIALKKYRVAGIAGENSSQNMVI